MDQLRNSHFKQFEEMKNLHDKENEVFQLRNGKSGENSLQMNESNCGTINQSDISGSLSQDMKRIEYFKAQEQENIDLKNKIKLIDSKFQDVVTNFNK